MGAVTECGLCGSQSLHTLLDMGIQPLAERFADDIAYPLLLLECGECSLVQLGYQVDQRILFPPITRTPPGIRRSWRSITRG